MRIYGCINHRSSLKVEILEFSFSPIPQHRQIRSYFFGNPDKQNLKSFYFLSIQKRRAYSLTFLLGNPKEM